MAFFNIIANHEAEFLLLSWKLPSQQNCYHNNFLWNWAFLLSQQLSMKWSLFAIIATFYEMGPFAIIATFYEMEPFAIIATFYEMGPFAIRATFYEMGPFLLSCSNFLWNGAFCYHSNFLWNEAFCYHSNFLSIGALKGGRGDMAHKVSSWSAFTKNKVFSAEQKHILDSLNVIYKEL